MSVATTIADLPSAKDHPKLYTRATSEQVEIFCVAFVFDGLTKADAYRRAFPHKVRDKSSQYVWGAASKFSQNRTVRDRLRALEMAQAKTFDYNLEELLQTYHGIAQADLSELYDDNGDFLPLSAMPKHIRKAIREVKHTVKQRVIGVDENGAEITEPTTVISEVKLENKTPALAKLAELKILQMGLKARSDGDSATGYAFTHHNSAKPDPKPLEDLTETKEIGMTAVARKMLTIMHDAEKEGLAAAILKDTGVDSE